MNKIKQARKQGFSLIELMIVVVIIGALTAIILPQFSMSESEALDTGCDASNYGTLSQLSKYASLNGGYPSRMHTGFDGINASDGIMGNMAEITSNNYASASTTFAQLSTNEAASLIASGIYRVASGGFGFNNAAFTQADSYPAVGKITGPWYEAWDGATLADNTSFVTINGLPLAAYQYEDPYLDVTIGADGSLTPNAGATADYSVIPLMLAPTTDWSHYVADGDEANWLDSKIGVDQAGGCPWLEGGADFRYYLAFFQVAQDGSGAKLIGTACPECGSLNP